MSLEGLAGLLLIATALAVWALWQSRRAGNALCRLEDDLRRAEAAGKEQAARVAALEAFRDSQQLTEQAIATSTAVVKEMHKGIAGIPFGVFEAIPATRAPAKVLRGLHDSISDGVYGALEHLNKAVGRELRKGAPAAAAAAAKSKLNSPPTVPPAAEPEASNDKPSEPSGKSWG